MGISPYPSVANYIVHAGGGNTLLYKVTNLMSNSSHSVVRSGSSMVRDVYGDAAAKISGSMASGGLSGGYFKNGNDSNGNYQKNKLSGE